MTKIRVIDENFEQSKSRGIGRRSALRVDGGIAKSPSPSKAIRLTLKDTSLESYSVRNLRTTSLSLPFSNLDETASSHQLRPGVIPPSSVASGSILLLVLKFRIQIVCHPFFVITYLRSFSAAIWLRRFNPYIETALVEFRHQIPSLNVAAFKAKTSKFTYDVVLPTLGKELIVRSVIEMVCQRSFGNLRTTIAREVRLRPFRSRKTDTSLGFAQCHRFSQITPAKR